MGILSDYRKEVYKLNLRCREQAIRELEIEEKQKSISPVKENLLIGKEAEIQKEFEKQLNDKYMIVPKVSINAILINQSLPYILDYVICKKNNYQVIAVILIKNSYTPEITNYLLNNNIETRIIELVEPDLSNKVKNLLNNLPPFDAQA